MSQQDERVKEQIVEDAPRMRSVAMLSHQPTTIQHGAFPQLGGIKTSPFGEAAKADNKVIGKTTLPSISKPWQVSALIAIPPYYQLERTHVHIPVGVSVVDVTTRIMEVFQHESIAAVYDDKEAKATAETKECVKFVIRLWNSNTNQIVVECQRAAGCGLTFCQVAKKVLRAARDGKKALAMKKKVPPKSIPSGIRDFVPKVPQMDMTEAVKDSLQIACDMMQSGRLDAQQLSIESLVHLSQGYKSQCFCARLILSNDILLAALLSLVLYSRLDRNGAEPPVGSIEHDCCAVMRRHSLTVLANCFSALDDSKAFGELIGETPALADYNLLKSLVLIVASAPSKPHEAADACKCLRTLCLRSESAKQRVADLDGSMYLENAQNCRHATLQDASVKLMVELRS